MAETVSTVTCDHCGEMVDARGSEVSVVFVTRDPVAGDPRTFLIIGNGRTQSSLLHSCAAEAWIRDARAGRHLPRGVTGVGSAD